MRFYISGDSSESSFLRTVLESKGYQVYTPQAQASVKSDLKSDNVTGDETFFVAQMRLSEKYQLRSILLEQRMAVKWCDIFVLLLPADADDHVELGIAVGLEKIIYIIGEPKDGKVQLSHARGGYCSDVEVFMKAISLGGNNAEQEG